MSKPARNETDTGTSIGLERFDPLLAEVAPGQGGEPLGGPVLGRLLGVGILLAQLQGRRQRLPAGPRHLLALLADAGLALGLFQALVIRERGLGIGDIRLRCFQLALRLALLRLGSVGDAAGTVHASGEDDGG